MGVGADGLAELPSRDDPKAVEVIRTLSSSVDRRLLPLSTSETGNSPRVDRLSIGLEAVDLGPDVLSVAEGEHILVVGAAASGVTMSLRGIAVAWREIHGAASVVTWPEIPPGLSSRARSAATVSPGSTATVSVASR